MSSSMNSDQAAPEGAARSGSILLANATKVTNGRVKVNFCNNWKEKNSLALNIRKKRESFCVLNKFRK